MDDAAPIDEDAAATSTGACGSSTVAEETNTAIAGTEEGRVLLPHELRRSGVLRRSHAHPAAAIAAATTASPLPDGSSGDMSSDEDAECITINAVDPNESPRVVKLRPLTPLQKRAKNDLLDRYSEFWRNISFSRGYSVPMLQCSIEEATGILDEAAEAVVRIRDCLIPPDASPPRVAEGNAVEFLWRQQHNPACDPPNFSLNIVLATFRDTSGVFPRYLSEAVITEFMQKFRVWKQSQKDTPEQKLEQVVLLLRYVSHQSAALAGSLERCMTAQSADQTCTAQSVPVEQLAQLAQPLTSLAKPLLIEISNYYQKCLRPIKYPEHQAAPPTQEVMNEPAAPLPVTGEVGMAVASGVEEAPTTATEQEHKEQKEESAVALAPAKEETALPVAAPMETDQPKAEAEVQPNASTPAESQSQATQQAAPNSDKVILEVKRVASNVAKLEPEIQQLTKHSELLNLSELSQNPLEGVKQVEKMQKKALEFGEYLMRDLLALDKLETSESSRPARKEQVIAIQKLMDEMDKTTGKLRELRGQLEKEARQIQEAREKEVHEEEKEQEKLASAPVLTSPSTRAAEPEGRDTSYLKQLRWSAMKLKPKMDVHEERGAYVIASAIPGLKKDEIALTLAGNDDALQIEGVRYPSEEELQQMEEYLDSTAPPALRRVDRATALMRMGAGRFGKFTEVFQLPHDVEVGKIQASYEGGILKVVLPKKPRPAPQYMQRYGYPSPFAGGFGDTNAPLGGTPGFFGDRDLWW
eukprot:TRINITY_DN2726_c0_g1_i1.p1 TRINITY_DN2726_c0_g1~~TRINITY_DN2726_c0_g1_i1.p1  ORF type:complete len:772 (+),score=201.41 TRINITY_DN2726_c0_g1_i1:55-2316(+)